MSRWNSEDMKTVIITMIVALSLKTFYVCMREKQMTSAPKQTRGEKKWHYKIDKKLLPIVKTVICCGKQEIALRGHLDTGPVKWEGNDKNDTCINDGNFRALLRFRIESGDEVLKNHLDTCNLNSSPGSTD